MNAPRPFSESATVPALSNYEAMEPLREIFAAGLNNHQPKITMKTLADKFTLTPEILAGMDGADLIPSSVARIVADGQILSAFDGVDACITVALKESKCKDADSVLEIIEYQAAQLGILIRNLKKLANPLPISRGVQLHPVQTKAGPEQNPPVMNYLPEISPLGGEARGGTLTAEGGAQ